MNTFSTTLSPLPPYDFNISIHSHRNKRYHYDQYDRSGSVYKCAIELRDQPALITVSDKGTPKEPRLKLSISGNHVTKTDMKKVKSVVGKQFLLDFDLKKFYSGIKHDSVMRGITKKFYGLKPNSSGDLFECITRCIMSQQISVHVADKVEMEFVRKFGSSIKSGDEIFYVFPTARRVAELSKSDLRSVKFSERKAEYLIDLARLVANGEVDLNAMEKLPNDEFRAEITKIRGIGHWTAECCLMHLGRWEIFPRGDLGLHQAVRLFYGFKKKIGEKEVVKIARQWAGWESLATYYLWHALTHARANGQ
ncbi:DNA-3-methyladenine glycosylase 2 family protein [bacterium]|nr:DNA-3-methyladenine glycosylase 2 family protein [bacterium]